jgi:3-deoxy-D-arabino-heptulosonate 7-phosphate (DAHP) synthase
MALATVFDGHKLLVIGADVIRAGANNLSVLALLDDVGAPP